MESNIENSHLPSFNQDKGVQQNGMQQTFTTNIIQVAEEKKVKFKDARPINYELKDIIEDMKQPTSPSTMATIDFRDELKRRTLREVVEIPVRCLRFRKNNGRIIADVESFEFEHKCKLDESADETQEILRGFLLSNDKERNEELKSLLTAKGQQQPAIATCDGFLINGNRRKMALEELYHENNQDSTFESMRVVLLPENVTELEIQQIENRYQAQREGKAEYKGLNRALMYRKNIQNGFTLKAQLKDDPNYHKLSEEKLQKEVEKYDSNFIQPLVCVDRYLKALGREGRYNSITEGANDRQGRWQAFIDYSKLRHSLLSDKEETAKPHMGKRDLEKLEMALFRVIRKRNLLVDSHECRVGKLHEFIRKIPKYLASPEATAEILAISKISNELPEAEKYEANGQPLKDRDLDLKWAKKHGTEILDRLQQARVHLNLREAQDKPILLMEDALRKLNYTNLDIRNMSAELHAKGLDLAKQIRSRVWEITQGIEDESNRQQHMEKNEHDT